MIGIKVILLSNLQPTPYDGQWVVEYDPWRFVENEIGAYLVTSMDVEKARRFGSMMEATEFVMQARGTRPWDGRPDRPLTAFTVELAPLPIGCEPFLS